MSKHQLRWDAAGEASTADLPVRLAEIESAEIEAVSRNDSLIRFLAAADDWQAAGRQLGGAFARPEPVRSRRENEE